MLYSNQDQTLYSFSLNGERLQKKQDREHLLIGPILCHDSNFKNHLMCIEEPEHNIVVFALPMLECRRLATKKNAATIEVFDSQRIAIIGDQDDNFSVLADPNCIGILPVKSLLIP